MYRAHRRFIGPWWVFQYPYENIKIHIVRAIILTTILKYTNQESEKHPLNALFITLRGEAKHASLLVHMVHLH
jgi:hypothetical protein